MLPKVITGRKCSSDNEAAAVIRLSQRKTKYAAINHSNTLLHRKNTYHISYPWVIEYEEAYMENLCLLDRSGGSGRRTLWMADAKRCQSLQCNRRAAAIVSAEHCVPHRLGNFVCPHGCWGRADLSGSGVQCPVTQPAAVSCAVGVQFLLEHHLLQFAGLWICFPLADRAVGFDPADDFVLPESG